MYVRSRASSVVSNRPLSKQGQEICSAPREVAAQMVRTHGQKLRSNDIRGRRDIAKNDFSPNAESDNFCFFTQVPNVLEHRPDSAKSLDKYII